MIQNECLVVEFILNLRLEDSEFIVKCHTMSDSTMSPKKKEDMMLKN